MGNLEEKFCPKYEKLYQSEGYAFTHNNKTLYHMKGVSGMFIANGADVWPGTSSDLNSIEILWHYVEG